VVGVAEVRVESSGGEQGGGEAAHEHTGEDEASRLAGTCCVRARRSAAAHRGRLLRRSLLLRSAERGDGGFFAC
jgi:hypothetical protein